MNDTRTGQLTSDWLIPAYAQNRLWLDSPMASARCEGEHGLFELDAPADVLTLRWNGNEGVPLTQLRWQPDNLNWDGSVRLAGLVEAVHLTEFDGIEYPIAVVMFSAQPLTPQAQPFPAATQRNLAQFDTPDYLDGVDVTQSPQTVPLLTFAENPLSALAQEALVQKYPLHVYGSLPDDLSGWHEHIALPIIWNSVTVFAP